MQSLRLHSLSAKLSQLALKPLAKLRLPSTQTQSPTKPPMPQNRKPQDLKPLHRAPGALRGPYALRVAYGCLLPI